MEQAAEAEWTRVGEGSNHEDASSQPDSSLLLGPKESFAFPDLGMLPGEAGEGEGTSVISSMGTGMEGVGAGKEAIPSIGGGMISMGTMGGNMGNMGMGSTEKGSSKAARTMGSASAGMDLGEGSCMSASSVGMGNTSRGSRGMTLGTGNMGKGRMGLGLGGMGMDLGSLM